MQYFKTLMLAVGLASYVAIGSLQAQSISGSASTLVSQAIELAAEATAGYFDPVDPLKQEQLRAQLLTLEAELNAFRQQGFSGADLDKAEALLLAIRPTLDVQELQATSLEYSVALLDYRLEVSQDYLPAIREFYDFETAIGLDTVQPGFNCQNASVPVEFTICSNLRLRDADGRMAAIYTELRNTLPAGAAEELLQTQLRWIQTRDTRCTANDVECLLTVYRERVADFVIVVAKHE